jgi:hypothetical protein
MARQQPAKTARINSTIRYLEYDEVFTWIDLLAFAIVVLSTGSTFRQILGLWM